MNSELSELPVASGESDFSSYTNSPINRGVKEFTKGVKRGCLHGFLILAAVLLVWVGIVVIIAVIVGATRSSPLPLPPSPVVDLYPDFQLTPLN